MTELSPVEKSTGTSATFSDDHCNHTNDKEHVAFQEELDSDKGIQGYKNIYSPMTFKCTQEFILVTFHSYSELRNR